MLAAAAAAAAAAAPEARPWLAPSQPIEARVASLLAAMTLEAKVAQTLQDISQRHSAASFLAQWGNTSLGAVSELYFSGESVDLLNAVQAALIANSTYGIPLLVWQETLHTAQSNGTIFPSPAGWGSTWDAALVRDAAAVIGAETRARGVHMGFSPELQVDTDPRFGRFMEAFSEDPRLVSLLGVAYATGAQGGAVGGPDSYGNFSAIITNAKHAAAYGQGGMDGIGTDIANRTLFDFYLRPWKHYFAEAGGRGAMISHQSLNGSPNHANRWLLTDVFRGLFNASHAFFASDDGDVDRLAAYGVALDCETGASLALAAGLDADLGPACFQTLVSAVRGGLVDEALVDRAAGNVLRSKFAAGLFDGAATADPSWGPRMQTPAAKTLAYRVAAEGVVLLQNENSTLPLDIGGAVRRVAVIGPNAGCAKNVLPKYCPARGMYEGAYSWFATGPCPTLLSVFEDAQANGTLTNVTFVQGANITSYETSDFPSAVAAACAADAAVAVVGDNNGGYSTGTCDEGIDSDTLDLPGGQLALLDAVSAGIAAGCPHVPLVVVLLNGRPATFGAGPFAATGANNALLARLPALIVAWQPGQEGAQAIFDVLRGAVNPSGRLAQNWLRAAGQVRGPASPWMQLRVSGLPLKYYSEPQHTTTPLFYFGAGLSYATFSLGGRLDLAWPGGGGGGSGGGDSGSGAPLANGSSFTATVNVSSAGPAGKCVVQVYASQLPPTKFVAYQAVLLCVAKVDLPADARDVPVAVACRADDLEQYDPDLGAFVTYSGNYSIAAALDAGPSLAATKARTTVALQGSYSWAPPLARGAAATGST